MFISVRKKIILFFLLLYSAEFCIADDVGPRDCQKCQRIMSELKDKNDEFLGSFSDKDKYASSRKALEKYYEEGFEPEVKNLEGCIVDEMNPIDYGSVLRFFIDTKNIAAEDLFELINNFNSRYPVRSLEAYKLLSEDERLELLNNGIIEPEVKIQQPSK